MYFTNFFKMIFQMIFTLIGKTGGSKAPEALLGTHRALPNSLVSLSGVLGINAGAARGMERVGGGSLGREAGEKRGSSD